MNFAASVKSRVLLGFGAMLVILGAATTGALFMVREYNSAVSAMESSSHTASLIQDARSDGGNAALLLQRFVISGDETIVPELRESTESAIGKIRLASEVEARSGDTAQALELGQIAAAAGPLGEAVDEVINRYRAGDTQGALDAVDGLALAFRQARFTLSDAANVEQQQLSERSEAAEEAGRRTLILFAVAGVTAVLTAGLATYAVGRSFLRPLAALDTTARRIGEGDLNARTTPSGPRELATLGLTLNAMADRLQERERDLILANTELRERNRQLIEARAQAATDGLTEVPNHRTFHESIRRLVPNAGEAPVSLVMLDIDGFKLINDRLGHQAGDEILRAVTAVFRRISNGSGIYRYGGDEFAVLLPNASIEEAEAMAERLRAAVEEEFAGSSRRVTISLGVASYPKTAMSPEELIYEADAAMYAAKMAGKNRVSRWDRLPSAAGRQSAPAF